MLIYTKITLSVNIAGAQAPIMGNLALFRGEAHAPDYFYNFCQLDFFLVASLVKVSRLVPVLRVRSTHKLFYVHSMFYVAIDTLQFYSSYLFPDLFHFLSIFLFYIYFLIKWLISFFLLNLLSYFVISFHYIFIFKFTFFPNDV